MPKDTEPVESTDITIGSDPELVCIDRSSGEIINIANVIPRAGEFGADGHGFIAELRPNPTVYPRDLMENIRHALLRGYDTFHNCDWQAGPFIDEKPLGGHIHLGTKLTDSLVEALAYQLAPIVVLAEPALEAAKRRTTVFVGSGGHINNGGRPYGELGDIKIKPYGFEWRTPSSFIVSPGVTLGILTLTKAIVWEEVCKGKLAWSKLPSSTRKFLKFNEEDFTNCNRKKLIPILQELWPLFRELDYFKEGKEGRHLWANLAYLKRCITTKGFKIYKDIKRPWKISKKESERLRELEGNNRIRRLPRRAADIRAERINRARRNRLGGEEWVMLDGIVRPSRDQIVNEQELFEPDQVFSW